MSSPGVGRVLVTGGAGFLGSHLVDRLRERGDSVVAVDNLSTGTWANLAHRDDDAGLQRITADIVDAATGDPSELFSGALAGIAGPFTAVCHLASPASPPAYLDLPLETLRVGSEGTRWALEVARREGARFLVTSTSEVYGDPAVNPQPESYWGNVNPVGPRSVYDEAKRYAEAITMAYRRTHGVPVRVARLFNTYGPRLRSGDGRVVSNFLSQAMSGRPLTVFGDGSQTRSFGYVDDIVDGLVALLDSDYQDPVNLGNPVEFTILELAEAVGRVLGVTAEVEFHDLPTDDPTRRRPDITVARRELGWSPRVDLDAGLAGYAEWLRQAGVR